MPWSFTHFPQGQRGGAQVDQGPAIVWPEESMPFAGLGKNLFGGSMGPGLLWYIFWVAVQELNLNYNNRDI